MLSETRKRLTIVYTMVFGVFLLVFTGIVCSVIVWGTYNERVDEIKSLANEIARNQISLILKEYKSVNVIPEEKLIEDDYDISGQVFYYIVNSNGQLVKADPPLPVLRAAAYEQFMNWDILQDTKFATVTLPTGETAALLLTAHHVYNEESLLATVYVGRDVTAYARSLFRSVFTLIGSAFLFLILAALIGYFLAGKITIPMEQSIQRKKQFIADASHELRTPLSVLLSSIEAIEMDKDNVLSSFSLQIMNDAKDEFFRLKRLVNDLLTLARADTGELKVKKELFSVNLVAEQVIRSLKTTAEQKKIRVQSVTKEPIELYADPARIHQLIYILVDNGLKYSSPNTEVTVSLEYMKQGIVPCVKIVVEDSGSGIPEKFQEQIFQRFFRIDESRSRNIEGSGLGLSIAQWIVDVHKGKIYVNSESSKGSQFIVLIPSR